MTGRALAQRGFDVAAIEEIVLGLFAGCAAGDTGAALVVRVDD